MDGGSSSTRALRNAAAGEIVEVQGGGRIMRSTAGRKDRHSKVCTARGPRDRRVRLAAHTAIQFYDVQDRLGFDRPSKAVDWLMKKAQSAIDALNQNSKPPNRDSSAAVATEVEPYDTTLLPPSMESDSIADTIKSFFPMGGGGGEGSSAATSAGGQSIQFQSYHSQDLKLSLQSFQEEQQSQIGFDSPSGGWNFSGGGYGGGGGGGLMFIPPQPSLQHQLVFSNGGGGDNTSGHFFTQGGPLQSNFTALATTTNSCQDHHHHQLGFSSFRIPARIQGDEEEDEQDGNPNKPFTLSSGSRH